AARKRGPAPGLEGGPEQGLRGDRVALLHGEQPPKGTEVGALAGQEGGGADSDRAGGKIVLPRRAEGGVGQGGAHPLARPMHQQAEEDRFGSGGQSQLRNEPQRLSLVQLLQLPALVFLESEEHLLEYGLGRSVV